MKLRVTPREFALLRDYIQNLCGILLQDEKAYLIENRLSGLAEKLGCRTFGELYLKVKNSPRGQDLQNQVVVAITTNETLWFRDGRPFRIMAERILPMLYGRIESGERAGINIWSAACSTGQEPYSIAMTVLDYLASAGSPPADLERVSILATDISPVALSKAISGVYDRAAIRRGLSRDYHDRYFRKEGDLWRVRSKVRRMVAFKEFNLCDPPRGVMGPFDIIFLRNVIIYFSDELKKRLFRRLSRILSPGGCLFLGTGETVHGYTDAFEILEENGAIYYRLKE